MQRSHVRPLISYLVTPPFPHQWGIPHKPRTTDLKRPSASIDAQRKNAAIHSFIWPEKQS